MTSAITPKSFKIVKNKRAIAFCQNGSILTQEDTLKQYLGAKFQTAESLDYAADMMKLYSGERLRVIRGRGYAFGMEQEVLAYCMTQVKNETVLKSEVLAVNMRSCLR